MSKLVDQFRMTDDSGSEKKEIVFNLGDLTAREWAHSAKEKSAEAERVANEAKEIAENAKQEVKEIAENAAEEVAGAKAVEVTGIKQGVVRWTDNDEVNKYILGCRIKTAPSHNSSTFSANIKKNPATGTASITVYTPFMGSYGVYAEFYSNGYVNVKVGDYGDIVELYISIEDFPEWLNDVKFEFLDLCRHNNLYGSSAIAGDTDARLDALESIVPNDIEYNKSLILSMMQMTLSQSSAALVYKNSSSDKIITSNETLADNPTRFTNDSIVEDIFKLDCAGVTEFTNVFLQGSTLEYSDKPLRTLILYNMQPTVARRAFRLQKLKTIRIYNSDFTNVSSIAGMFGYAFEVNSIDLSEVPMPNVNNAKEAFEACHELKFFKLPDDFGTQASSVDIAEFITYSWSIQTIDLSGCSFKVNNANRAFDACVALENLYLGNIDFSAAGNLAAVLNRCKNLRNFSGLKNVKSFYYLDSSPLLTHESALNCIAGLYDLTEGGTVTDYRPQTLRFHEDVKAQLTEEEIAEATAKGWNIA